jgi:hypothetical protein
MPLRETAADSGVRNYAPGCERLPLRYDIWHDDGCDHQDVKVGHEVRWLSKIEAQGEASKKKDEGHSVRADRPDAVLSELAIARSKDCRKGADEPKCRLRISEVAEEWRLRGSHEKRHKSSYADGPNVDSAEYPVKPRVALTEASGELEWTHEHGCSGSQNVRD